MKGSWFCSMNPGSIFHDWSEWEQYEEHGIVVLGRLAPKSAQGNEYTYTKPRQRRSCKKCKFLQTKDV